MMRLYCNKKFHEQYFKQSTFQNNSNFKKNIFFQILQFFKKFFELKYQVSISKNGRVIALSMKWKSLVIIQFKFAIVQVL